MLLTGRYPLRTGWHTHHDTAIYGGGYLDWNREITFARLLRDAGYKTCISGKWQINDLFDPQQTDALNEHGFQKHCIWPEAKPGLPAHKKRYWDAYIIADGKQVDTAGKFGPDVCTDYSIDFIRQNRDQPFLLYQSAILTHIPVTTTPHDRDESATPREKFANMLRYADHLIGRLVATLDEVGIRDNTLVFIATDNGTDTGSDQGMPESLGGRINGRISAEGIYSLSERGINMPLIVNCPGWIQQGCESDALTNAADVLPTLVELAGADLPSNVTIDGHSFASVLKDNADRSWQRDWTFTQYAQTRVIRDDRYKLYSNDAFYDLASDPLEQANLQDNIPTDAQDAHDTLQTQLRNAARRTRNGLGTSAASRHARCASLLIESVDVTGRSATTGHPQLWRGSSNRQASTETCEASASPLQFADGTPVKTADDWKRRREEILKLLARC